MLDFIFRRGNPTNDWKRSDNLSLSAEMDVPSLNGIKLSARFDHLSFLGRNNASQFESLCYFDLGIGVEQAEDGTFQGYTIVLFDENNEYQSYCGKIIWNRNQLDVQQLTYNDLPAVFGDWYWVDTDEDESIVFYEYPQHEMQIELTPSGTIKRFIITQDPLMSDPAQREAYHVDKPWPPQFHT